MSGIYETNQVLKLQEVGDTIYIAQSEKVPMSRLMPRGRAPVQMLSEWPVQKYPRRAFTGTMDGTDVTTFEHTTRDKLSAYGMLLRTPGWMATKLSTLTATAGVGKNEKAKQMRDDGLLMAQMHERQLLSNQDTQAESGPATPYLSRGLFSWLSTTAQSTLPVPASYRPPAACKHSGALSTFTPEAFETMLQAAAGEKFGPVDLTGFLGIKLKTRMSKWQERVTDATGIEARSLNVSQTEKKLIAVVDMFEFDAGMVRTIPSWFMHCDPDTGEDTDYTSRSGAFLDMAMWELCFLQAATHYELPDLGGGPRGYHDETYILRCKNPLGQVYVETDTD